MKHFITLLCSSVFSSLCIGQTTLDTINIVSYNTLNYGYESSNCPSLITANKHAWLRTVVRYTQPDILGLVKMEGSLPSFYTDTIIQVVLGNEYGHTPYTNNSGYKKENMVYYRNSKIGFISTTTIYLGDPNISDINLHRLYYKSPYLATTHDTTFLNIILVHLISAGSGTSTQRGTEVAGAMSWLNSHITSPGNYIFMGDFNVTSSNESCFQQLINSSNPNMRFVEPTGELGDWSNNPQDFAKYLTQSPRLNDPGDCGATGGLNDWLDHILCSPFIINGTDSVTYIPGTFHVISNDGQHVDQDLLALPQDTAVPDSILNAVYYMSSHLPVMLQLQIRSSNTHLTGVQSLEPMRDNVWNYNQVASDYLLIKSSDHNILSAEDNYRATIYDFQGRKLRETDLEYANTNSVPISVMADGVYILVISNRDYPVYSGRFVKLSR